MTGSGPYVVSFATAVTAAINYRPKNELPIAKQKLCWVKVNNREKKTNYENK